MRISLAIATLCVIVSSSAPAQDVWPRGVDSRLQAASEWVLASERYLHQSHLTRGMTGYGLTVMSGAEIVRFDVEIVSVLVGYGAASPQRDVILARVSGQGLETTGIIAGMSGSPVYIRHEGEDKLIGAVAYGYSFQKNYKSGPLCGIQPIAQMLAVAGGPLDNKLGVDDDDGVLAGASASAGGASLPEPWRAEALATEKTDFSTFGLPANSGGKRPAPAGLQPLTTPIMSAGLTERSAARLNGALEPMNASAMRSGRLTKAAALEAASLKLAPGAAVSIPLVRGDEDLNGVGTVTEVLGEHVLAFGHPMFGDGQVSYPMGTAYVHTVVASMQTSFKLGQTVDVVGELRTDEYSAVGGRLGRPVEMIPVAVDVAWADTGQKQNYRFEIVRDPKLTTLLAMTVAADSVWGTRKLPREHTVEYAVEIDFGDLGTYEVANLSAGGDVYDMMSDLTRALGLMMNNPFGVATPRSIRVKVDVAEGVRGASILGATLDRNAYAPGDTVTATVAMRRHKGPRFTREIAVTLPRELPEGDYALTVGDWATALEDRRKRRPRLFDPRSLAQLLDSIETATETRMNGLYAILPTGEVGVAVEAEPIPHAPGTIKAMLAAAAPLDVTPVAEAVTATELLDEVVAGRAEVMVNVRKNPPRP